MPQPPRHANNAKSGHQPGEGAHKPDRPDPKRPVDEEDIFGGAERTDKTEPISSDHAKP
ncbi:MAG: hypothetical protein JNK94_08605 [Hyphomonadaceae bacterium]|nr:hypothetical protein [Hyphomonadaceae bacterium]